MLFTAAMLLTALIAEMLFMAAMLLTALILKCYLWQQCYLQRS